MKRFHRALLFLALSILVAAVLGIATSGINFNLRETWDRLHRGYRYDSPNGGFTILFPQKRGILPDTQEETGGTIVHEVSEKVELPRNRDDDCFYSVSYLNVPKAAINKIDPADLLLKTADRMLREHHEGTFFKYEVNLNGYPGVALGYDTMGQFGRIYTRHRLYLVENRLFKLTALVSQKVEKADADDKFFSSFQLKTPHEAAPKIKQLPGTLQN